MSSRKLTDLANVIETHTRLPNKEDYYADYTLALPEWVVEHILTAGNFPEDWLQQIMSNCYRAESFTVANNPNKAGVVISFYPKHFDFGH